jgi:hypothetical protein
LTSNQDLELMWSCREQLYLFDRHDAFWISQAKGGWDDDEEQRKFLVSYSLHRGKPGSFLLHNSNKIWKKLSSIYNRPVDEGDTDTINKHWREANTLVNELSKKNSKNHNGFQFHSFTLKLYWFYQPHTLTMFDRYSCKALNNSDRKVTPENYLEAFEDLYRQHEKRIAKMCSESDRVYKYPRRVLDLWLWLQGSERKDKTMKRFRAAVEPAS